MASWAGSLRSWAMVLAASVTWVARGWAAVLSWSAASRSFWLAGIREETSMPAPKAISPAARGLPAVFGFTWAGGGGAGRPGAGRGGEAGSCAWGGGLPGGGSGVGGGPGAAVGGVVGGGGGG